VNPRHDPFGQRPDPFGQFNRTHRRVTALFVVAWFLSAVISLAVVGVLVWAVITLVRHYT
jgi:hypothetical protein